MEARCSLHSDVRTCRAGVEPGDPEGGAHRLACQRRAREPDPDGGLARRRSRLSRLRGMDGELTDADRSPAGRRDIGIRRPHRVRSRRPKAGDLNGARVVTARGMSERRALPSASPMPPRSLASVTRSRGWALLPIQDRACGSIVSTVRPGGTA